MDKVPDRDRDKLGVAIGQQAYAAYRGVLDSDRWERLANCGAREQRFRIRMRQQPLIIGRL